MADNSPTNSRRHGRGPSTPQTSIPLQDLGPTGQNAHLSDGSPSHSHSHSHSQSHRRTLSDRGRSLFRRNRDNLLSTNSAAQPPSNPRAYSPISESPPSPPSINRSPRTFVTSPTGHRTRVDSDHDDELTPLSPIEGNSFQQAMGFAGLSMGVPVRPSLDARHGRLGSIPSLRTVNTLDEDEEPDDPTGFFPPEADLDTVPLTDMTRLEARPTRDDRTSFQSVRFLSPSASHSNFADIESGNLSPSARWSRSPDGHSHSHSRSPADSRRSSLSPSAADSPFHRASTMMRKMSMRVVNLSNEPEVAERMIHRKSSIAPPPHMDLDASEYATDGHPRSPVAEKTPSPILGPVDQGEAKAPEPNPFRGKSLGIFPPDSKLRLKLADLLLHPVTEPFILVLIVIQTILLAVSARGNVFNEGRSKRFGDTWIDIALLVLFIIYTIEIVIRIIVSGFMVNSVEYSTIDRKVGLRTAIVRKANDMFALHRKPSVRNHFPPLMTVPQPGILRSFTTNTMLEVPGGSKQAQLQRLAFRAFLRHSFNRLDFVAVVSFWISFIIGVFGVESQQHVFVFRMLSCLRIVRLLGITSGTLVILRSLKKAAPTLLNVAFLTGFFWLLFAIVGVQSFKSSLRRTCVWTNPNDASETFTNDFQFCGGYLMANGTPSPWLRADGVTPGAADPKGFFCPINSMCIEGDNPYNGTMSFDNLFQSIELVFVVMTSNTFSDLLYYLADSDYLAAALFFAAGIIIFPLWLVNLLIAVITSSFQVIRDESKASAFTAQEQVEHLEAPDKDKGLKQKMSTLQQLVNSTRWIWIAVILYGLIVQCLRSAYMSPTRAAFLSSSELGVTIALDFEILLRFIANWRYFHKSKRNMIDLGLAIITTIIQIPVIKNSGQPYAWLTVFQIVRIYRVVLAVDMTRDLILTVLGDFSGLANLILFVFLLCFLGAIFATQIFRGQIPFENDGGEAIQVSFFDIYNAFLGMYQMFSSENWTDILYDVTSYNVRWNNGWIGAAFCILWFILANFIVLNMFIAVIQENFDVSEDEKRLQQVKAFLSKKQVGASSGQGALSLSSIFKVGQARRQDPLDYGSAQTEMLLKDAVVKDFLDEHDDVPESPPPVSTDTPNNTPQVQAGTLAQRWEQMLDRLFNREPNPFYSNMGLQKAHEEVDTRQMVKEVVAANDRIKRAQRDYLRKYPNYNVSLFVFRVDNPVRKLCQRLVGPGRGGDRIEGVAPSRPLWFAFSAFIYATIVAMVLLACVTTPLYQKVYFQNHHYTVKNWFVFSDIGFAALFTIESVIRIIADGFYWTPNAYYRSSWGVIDGVVLITLWSDIITTLYNPGGGSRAVGAFKALRALRLLNISDNARDTFHSVIVMGGWKVISAAFVSLSLLVPFAIYGLNIFNGKMMSCNDGGDGIFNLTDCTGEYLSSPYDWNVLAPRQVGNSYYDFDNFGASLFILFQIVSQEGWIDVMWSAQSITGIFTQPDDFTSQGNALFFVVFNLLGAVFVLTLFISVFMRNYTEQTGVAFLTTDQRSWLELRKLLRQISPSKRPSSKEVRQTWKEWCYRRAVHKNGKWQRSVTFVLIFHLLLLCLEWYPEPPQWERARDFAFLALTLFYIVNVVVRIVGLSWTRFRKSAWDVYSLFSVSGTFVTLILLLTNFRNRDYVQVHKLFLVSITLLLIPRNNQLDQLFKTAAASLTSIANLLATWFVLFLVYAIAFTQTFGLTRFGENETDNQNFRTVPKALIMLFRMSSGEGWNQVMNDFEEVTSPYCTIGEHYYDGDCGSSGWAMALFISWNILSMYVFMNLFISLIYESFSYVYQRSSGLSVISREEIRRFKQAWAEFDPSGSGYIPKEKFPRLLGELSGIFEMRIYDGDFTVGNILDDCTLRPHRAHPLGVDGPKDMPHVGPFDSHHIDLARLNERLNEIPVEEIRRRRRRMNTFYEEVLVSADPDRGVEFNSLLMILAHYKVINDNKSLRLEEFLRRRARLQRVEEAVRRNVVVGFFDTLYWARRFRRAMEAKRSARMTAVPQLDVPEIFVHDESEDEDRSNNGQTTPTGPSTPIDHQSPSWTTGSDGGTPLFMTGTGSSTGRGRNRSDSIQISPAASPTRSRASQQPSPQISQIPEDWHFAEALIEGANRSRSPSPSRQYLDPDGTSDAYGGLGVGVGSRGRAQTLSAANPEPEGRSRAGTLSTSGSPAAAAAAAARSRAASSVNQQNVLDMLDTSAWGESIRRSFTTRGSVSAPRRSLARGSVSPRRSPGRGSVSPTPQEPSTAGASRSSSIRGQTQDQE